MTLMKWNLVVEWKNAVQSKDDPEMNYPEDRASGFS